MAERLNAAVSKTAISNIIGIEGSNPSLSTNKSKNISRLFAGVIVMPESQTSENNSVIVSATCAQEVYEYIFPLKGTTLILFDVDDTLITPQSKTFKAPPFNQMMDRIKANKTRHPRFKEILSNWRRQRVAMLVDQKWPEIITILKKTHNVYGLTKINSGHFGTISNMEEWRYQELLSLGIEFSQDDHISNNREKGSDKPTFHKGVFLTGASSKIDTLRSFWSSITPPQNIVFIDDKQVYLEEINQFCKEHHINFIGVHFNGLSKLGITPDPELAAFQEKYLIEHAEWLEDDVAYAAMRNSHQN